MSAETPETPHETPTQSPPAVDLWPATVPDAERASRVVVEMARTVGASGESYGVRFPSLVGRVTGEPAFELRDREWRKSAAYDRVWRTVEDLVKRGIVRRESVPQYVVVDDEAVAISSDNDDVYVYPEWIPPAFESHLKVSRHTSSPPDPDTPNRPTGKGWLSGNAGDGDAAEEVRSVLRNRTQITPHADGVKAKIGHAAAAARQGLDHEGMREERLSSTRRAMARQGAYLNALNAACDPAVVAENVATHVTLTADGPGSYGDLVDAASAINDDVDDLLGAIGRRTPGPGRATTLVIREVTKAGRLHLHVLIFGVDPQHLRDEGLGDYWQMTKGHGHVAYSSLKRRMTREGWRWLVVDDAEVESGTPIRGYLGEMLIDRRRVTELDAEDLHEVAKGQPRDGLDRHGLVQVAVLWATGIEAFSASEILRNDGTSAVESIVRIILAGKNRKMHAVTTDVSAAIPVSTATTHGSINQRDRPPPTVVEMGPTA